MLCRDDTPEELCYAVRKTTTDVVFVHDYISKEDEELMRNTTQARRIVKISPLIMQTVAVCLIMWQKA